jgi:hypothetical protein
VEAGPVILGALAGIVLAGVGGFALATRLCGREAPLALRAGLAWPLGSGAVAWCHFWMLLAGAPMNAALWLAPAALLCALARRGDLRGPPVRLETWAALLLLAVASAPAWIARAGVGFVDADMLSIWARRALGYRELGGPWPEPSLHAYSGYPHLVTLRILGALVQGGTAAEPIARQAAWLDLAAIVLVLGALGTRLPGPMPLTDQVEAHEDRRLQPAPSEGLSNAGRLKPAVRRDRLTALLPGRVAAFLAQAAVILAHPLLIQGWTGYADLPLAAAILGCGALLLRDRRLGGARTLVVSGVFAGLAAFTKREGEAFAAAVSLAVVLVARRPAALLLPAAALVASAPEWVYRAAFETSWPEGTGRPDWRRAVEILAAIGESRAYVALALPAAAALLVAVLCARRPDRVAGRGVVAAAVAVAGFCCLQTVALMASPMYLSVQLATALDRLLAQSLPLALAIAVTVADPGARAGPAAG